MRKKGNAQKWIISLMMILGFVCVPAGKVEAATNYGTLIKSGDCSATTSDMVTWAVYDSNADGDNVADVGDTIVIRGTGSMKKDAYSLWKDYKTTLTKVVIEEGVTNIGERAFYQFAAIREVSIAASVTTMEYGAFVHNTSLTTVTFAEKSKLKNIGSGAFNGCSALQTIVIPEGVETIDGDAFWACSKLKNVTLPSTLKTIVKAAFGSCTALEEIVLPSSLETIEKSAFEACTSLKKIVIPSSVSSLGVQAFARCEQLTEVVILSDDLTTENIGGYLFSGSKAIETVIYNGSDSQNDTLLTDMGLTSVPTQMEYKENSDGTVSVTVVSNSSSSIILPDDIGGKTISSVSAGDNVSLEDVTIEHSVHSFGKSACICGYVPFTISGRSSNVQATYGATNSVTLSVTAEKTLGDEVLTYQWYEGGKSIEAATDSEYTLPVKKAAGNYQYYCKVSCGDYELDSVEIVVTIAKRNITVLVDNAERTVGEENPIFTFTIVEGELAKGDTTDDWTVNLTTAATKDSKAGTYSITGTITHMNYNVMVKEGMLTVKQSVPMKGTELQDTKKLAKYKVTKAGSLSGVTGTVEYVKPVNKKKTTVTIPATITVDGVKYKVTSIAKNAFKNNRYIKKVTIGSNIKSIGANAFYNCKKLKNITIKSKSLKAGKVGKKAFKGIKSNATIKVPKKKYKSYKAMLKKKGVSTKAKFKKN